MNQNWDKTIRGFKVFLGLERSLSENSVLAYVRDVNKIEAFLRLRNIHIPPDQVSREHLADFLIYLNELGVSPRSQARIISGIKSFFRYLLLEERISVDPAALLEPPRVGRKLPEVLSIEEIDRLISSIDLSKKEVVVPVGRWRQSTRGAAKEVCR